jgi:hypothetical protein
VFRAYQGWERVAFVIYGYSAAAGKNFFNFFGVQSIYNYLLNCPLSRSGYLAGAWDGIILSVTKTAQEGRKIFL